MKNLLLIISFFFIHNQGFTQMETTFINTSIGNIAVHAKVVEGTTPIIFLHGVYYDYRLWEYQTSRITDRTVIAIDMPFHGESVDNIKANWSLEDGAMMLIEILDAMEIESVYAIGHSWGSMTVLRAASKYPQRFKAVGFCNLPFKVSSDKQKRQLKLAHRFLFLRNIYTKQAAKSIIGKSSLKANNQALNYLKSSMGKLSKSDIKMTDYAVIIHATDATDLVDNLTVKALCLKGKEDYVNVPGNIPMTIVNGGHSSPMEASEAVLEFIKKVILL